MTGDGITQFADDIIGARIPLPYALNSVNCYLLRGRAGWTLLDTGLNTAPARAAWRRVMAALGIAPDDIEKIVLTHMHPDHFGMAGWWQRQATAPMPLWLPEREIAQMRILYRGENAALYRAWMLDCGMDPATVDRVDRALESTRDLTKPHPLQQEYLEAGALVMLGERECRAIHAPGHSDGQLLFYDEGDRLLFCGDHVLMRITPNIGAWPHTAPDPLGRFLASLRALRALDVRVALPGHRQPVEDWGGRIAELIAHHETRLAQTVDALAAGARTVYAVSARLFDLERLSPHEWRFAMAEARAHLERLQARDLAILESGEQSRWRLAD